MCGRMEIDMNFLKLRRVTSAFSAAVLICTAVSTASLNIRDASAEETKKAPSEAAGEAEIPETKETEYNENKNGSWWKADLSDYDENFSIVSYETIKPPPEKPKAVDGVLLNDTGISYIEPHSDYQAIQIVPDNPTSGQSEEQAPRKKTESGKTVVAPGSFVFTTYGYGHGVGMSQNGANHYAAYSGWNYEQILDHYYPGTYIQKKEIKKGDKITAGGVSGSVFDIVSMVTYNELGGSMSQEAMKAQAVAAYTYIMYKGGNAADLYPKPDPPQSVKDAVNSVLGEALYYNGSYALAMFCASSGGSTASCVDIFYQNIPYLRSVSCEYDNQYDPHYGTVEVISQDEVRAELEKNLNITLSDDPEKWIYIIKGDGGYTANVLIDNRITIKGNDFRTYLGLKSPKFEVEYH